MRSKFHYNNIISWKKEIVNYFSFDWNYTIIKYPSVQDIPFLNFISRKLLHTLIYHLFLDRFHHSYLKIYEWYTIQGVYSWISKIWSHSLNITYHVCEVAYEESVFCKSLSQMIALRIFFRNKSIIIIIFHKSTLEKSLRYPIRI